MVWEVLEGQIVRSHTAEGARWKGSGLRGLE